MEKKDSILGCQALIYAFFEQRSHTIILVFLQSMATLDGLLLNIYINLFFKDLLFYGERMPFTASFLMIAVRICIICLLFCFILAISHKM